MPKISDAMKAYISLISLFFILIIILPANKLSMLSYHLTPGIYHILLILIMLPMIAIWFAAFYGYGQIKKYSLVIKDTAEGVDFNRIARGSKWLAWGYPISAITSLVLDAIANQHPGFKGADEIISNYLTLFITLVAFSIFSKASGGLTERLKLRISASRLRVIVILFVSAGVAYCFLIFRQMTLYDTSSTKNLFHMPSWLVITSLIIPYLYVWFSGLLTAYEIYLYGRYTHGVLYRQAIGRLAVGISLVISSLICLEYITTIQPQPFHLVLSALLVITYIFRFIFGLGFGLIAIAAIRLLKIEEV